MTEKETIEKQLQLLEQQKSNLEVLKEKHINQAESELERVKSHYDSEFERVKNEKSALEDQLKNLNEQPEN